MNWVAMLLAVVSSSLFAGGERAYVCPAEVSVETNVNLPSDGWQALDSSVTVIRHPVSGATFTDGHPDDSAYLRPRVEEVRAVGSKGARLDVYRFPAKYPDGIWLVCRYKGTSAILFKQLPELPESCEIRRTLQTPGQPVEKIVCR